MMEFWATLSVVEKFFAYSAGLGSLFFVVRAISLCMGAFSGHGADLDGDGVPDALEQGGGGMADLDGDGTPDALESNGMADLDGNGIPDALETHAGSPGDMDLDNHEILVEKVPFFKKFLSIQNVSIFFMMLGWVGLAMTKSSGFGPVPATLAGLLVGFASAFILMKVTDSLMKLSRTGNARASSAIGKIGRVYLRIPAKGDGQIEVEVDGRLKVMDAVSSDETEIKTDSQVLVIDVKRTLEKDILVVKEYNSAQAR